jgi:hypothetical protein
MVCFFYAPRSFVNGIGAFPVEVEVNAGWGDTLVVLLGRPDAALEESLNGCRSQAPGMAG